MSVSRFRLPALLVAAGLGLGACSTYDDYGYGYSRVSVGYNSGGYCDPYFDDCYYGRGRSGYGDPWYGWYNDYYYPGIGIYIYDRSGRRHRWGDDHRRYWEGRRGGYRDRNWNDRRWERWDGYRGDRSGGNWRGRGDRSERQDWREDRVQVRENRRDFRQDRRGDRSDFRTERRGDRQAVRSGTVTREQFRQDRQQDRREFRRETRQDRRGLRRENRRDRRD